MSNFSGPITGLEHIIINDSKVLYHQEEQAQLKFKQEQKRKMMNFGRKAQETSV